MQLAPAAFAIAGNTCVRDSAHQSMETVVRQVHQSLVVAGLEIDLGLIFEAVAWREAGTIAKR